MQETTALVELQGLCVGENKIIINKFLNDLSVCLGQLELIVKKFYKILF